jgi:hypothetical protein
MMLAIPHDMIKSVYSVRFHIDYLYTYRLKSRGKSLHSATVNILKVLFYHYITNFYIVEKHAKHLKML